MQALHDIAAARTLAMSAVASPHAEAPPSLHSFLAARWAAVDQKTFALVMCVHASVLLKGALQPLELVTYRMLLAAHTACLALSLAAPRAYLRHRSAIVSALRLVDVVLLPVLVDMHRIHQPASAATAVGAAAPPAVFNGSISSSGSRSGMPLSLHSLTMHGVVPALRAAWPHARGCLHAGLLFMVAVTRMHGCLAAAAGAPLPPALHLLLHAATVGALCMQSPTGEAQRVALLGAPGNISITARHCCQAGDAPSSYGRTPNCLCVYAPNRRAPLAPPLRLQHAGVTWALPTPTMPCWWRACSGCCAR